MRTVIYARVSTADQTCEMQLRELREYIARRGWEPAGEYVDTGWSGAKMNRPQLDQLMLDARMRRFDAVLVWKLDRWGRSVAHSIKTIPELIALDIRFLAVTQNIDTDESNPMSRFLMHIFAAFAELEREMIRERTLSGIKAAQAAGKVVGRPRRIFRRDELLMLRDQQNLSWRAISKQLNVPVSTLLDAYRSGCTETVPSSEQKSRGKRKPKTVAA